MLSKVKPFFKKSKSFIGNSAINEYCTFSTSAAPSNPNECTLTPNYPPLEITGDDYIEAKTHKEDGNKFKTYPTVEEKILAFNVPRRWGWKCFMIHEGAVPYNNLEFAQYITRTHLIKTQTLPHHYENFHQKSLVLAKQLRNSTVDSLEYQLHIRHRKVFQIMNRIQREKEITRIIVNELNRIIMKTIGNEMDHAKSLQTDYSPRIEASWKINSLVETPVNKVFKHGIPAKELPEEYLDRPSDKFIQYIGQPILQLRHAHQLSELISFAKANIFEYSVPAYKFDPHVLGYEMTRRHTTNIPGFWPGDDRDFSFLSYHCLNDVKNKFSAYEEADMDEAVQSQILFASFGWLMALASYQGFTVYNDITYPFVTQTVATDGKKFVFAAYQLNTIATNHKNPYENSACNICWITPEMPLFEEYIDGKLKGFNESTLQMLFQLYANKPIVKSNMNTKPFLGKNIKYIANYENDEKREWLEEKFKHISANKPPARPDLMYEVYDWEKIFKIQFRMRPRDARRRPFELRQNPYHQKMSETPKKYIPKALRPDKHLPKWRQRKFVRTFYPE